MTDLQMHLDGVRTLVAHDSVSSALASMCHPGFGLVKDSQLPTKAAALQLRAMRS